MTRRRFTSSAGEQRPFVLLLPALRGAFSPRDKNNNFTLRNTAKLHGTHALIDHSLCIYSNLLPVSSIFFFSPPSEPVTGAMHSRPLARKMVWRARNERSRRHVRVCVCVCALGIIKKSTDRYRAWRLINMQRERAIVTERNVAELPRKLLNATT